MSVVLDTHAALWLVQGDSRLSSAAVERISSLGRDETYISDLMLFEIALLVSKKRVVIEGALAPFLREFASHFHILPVDPGIAALASETPLPQSDPFDRIFVATASRYKLPMITRDREIQKAGIVETIW